MKTIANACLTPHNSCSRGVFCLHFDGGRDPRMKRKKRKTLKCNKINERPRKDNNNKNHRPTKQWLSTTTNLHFIFYVFIRNQIAKHTQNITFRVQYHLAGWVCVTVAKTKCTQCAELIGIYLWIRSIFWEQSRFAREFDIVRLSKINWRLTWMTYFPTYPGIETSPILNREVSIFK